MTGGEIIEWKVNLKECKLIEEQKAKVYKLIEEHLEAIILHV